MGRTQAIPAPPRAGQRRARGPTDWVDARAIAADGLAHVDCASTTLGIAGAMHWQVVN